MVTQLSNHDATEPRSSPDGPGPVGQPGRPTHTAVTGPARPAPWIPS